MNERKKVTDMSAEKFLQNTKGRFAGFQDGVSIGNEPNITFVPTLFHLEVFFKAFRNDFFQLGRCRFPFCFAIEKL